MKLFLYSISFILLFLSCKKEQKTAEAAAKMQEFVMNISTYCKADNPDFLIIPQNGIQLAFNNANIEEGFHSGFMNAVDGFGVEEIFYNGKYKVDNERLDMLQQLKTQKPILVSDYVKDDSNISDDIEKNSGNNFLCFPRSKDNYYYTRIPDVVINENTNDITQLSEAKNFLYLLNPENYNSKSEYLNALKATNFDIILIDLFFNDEELTSTDIASLKTKTNGGKRLVIAYMNIGSAENYRYYWKSDWKLHQPSWLKKKYPGYKDEFYVAFWDPEWQNIIYGSDASYVKKIINAGFDGTYLDNVEAYYFLYNK
ncbi:MAG: endo alpha-1,4 polygalactosaminidase [Flavobacteriia bacterium]|nr:endo alpha-1,4 polygalactosaminidase [Flavobacteriia bacterium]